MKSEQEIKDRILTLVKNCDLSSLIAVTVLLWVLDTEPSLMNAYIGNIERSLKEISDYINTLQVCQPSDVQESVLAQ